MSGAGRFNGYKRFGHRISLTTVTRYCSKSADLSEAHGVSRAAIIGRAGHARLSDQPGYANLLAQLDPKEREEVESWKRPTPIRIAEGEEVVELDYESADKELLIGLDWFGGYADPTKQDVLARGDLDFAWVRTVGGRNVAYVCDIKRTAFTAADDVDLIQLACYGFAYASLMGCEAFVPGIWVAQEGYYRWGSWVDLGSPEAIELWEDRIVPALTNKSSGYVTGEHCRKCYGRVHCPEWLLPAAFAEQNTVLAAVAEGGEPTPENALTLLDWLAKYEAVAKLAKDQLQALVRAKKISLRDSSGNVWRPVPMPGREGVSIDRLRSELGAEAEKYIKRGKSFDQFRWCKADR